MNKLLRAFSLFVFTCTTSYVFGQQKTDYQAIADSLYNSKDYKGAIENYGYAIKANQQNKIKLSTLLDDRALAELKLKLFKDAITDETDAMIANPKAGNPYWNRGVAYYNTDRLQLAADDYTKAMTYFNDRPITLSTLYNNRGTVNRKLKNYKKAIDDHSQALVLNPKKTGAYWERALAYNLNGDYQLAIDDYTSAMFYNQEAPKELCKLYDNRAQNKRALKQYKEAINDLNMALQLDPDNININWHRGLLYEGNGDYALAVKDYTTAMRYYQDDKENLAILYDNRARNEMALRQSDQAFADITTAIGLAPTRGHLYLTRANFYSQNGDCKQAIEEYAKTIPFYKDNNKALAALHYYMASNLYILNENSKVIEECTTSNLLNPKFGSPNFLRGKVYLKRLINKDLAIKDFNRAIELDTTKKTVSYIFSQFYTGHTDLALELLQQEVLSTPNPDDVLTHYYNIACIFSIMNKPDEANTYLKKAIDSGYPKKFVANDEDFDNIRKTTDYLAIMADRK